MEKTEEMEGKRREGRSSGRKVGEGEKGREKSRRVEG